MWRVMFNLTRYTHRDKDSRIMSELWAGPNCSSSGRIYDMVVMGGERLKLFTDDNAEYLDPTAGITVISARMAAYGGDGVSEVSCRERWTSLGRDEYCVKS